MILLFERFNKFYSKLENHHHHHHHHHRHRHESEALLSSYLKLFESDVSFFLNQIPSNPDSSSEFLSFPWILQVFHVLSMIHQAFAKLIVNLDYPIGKWGGNLIDDYLNFSLSLLDFFNYITFSLSQLNQSRVLLSHALTLVEKSPSSAITRLNPILPRFLKKGFKELGTKEIGKDQKRNLSVEELVIEKALMIMEGIGYWVCGIVISGCEGDSMAYLEMRKFSKDMKIPSFERLDSSIFKVMVQNGSVIKEVAELNDVVARLVDGLVAGTNGSGEAEEMRKRLEDLEKKMESLVKEVNEQFSEVFAGRSKLLDVFRQQKH